MQAAVISPPATKRVLIAEDNEDLRQIFSYSFNRKHFCVTTAVDGAEAIRYLEAELPDVLILDINMPKITGVDVLKYIHSKQRFKNMKVIVVTGNCLAMQVPEAEYADLFLIKPISLAELMAFTSRLL